MKTLLNRADLLACLNAYRAGDSELFAVMCGFVVVEQTEQSEQSKHPGQLQKTQQNEMGHTRLTITENSSTEIRSASPKPQTSFLHAISHHRFNDDEVITEQPDWFEKAEPYQDNDAALKAPVNKTPPPQQPLMAWRRLWPLLKLALGAYNPSHQPDLPRIVDQLAKGVALRRLPKARRKGWAGQAQLIVDFDPSLLPFWADFNGLHQHLADVRGQTGLTVLAFPQGDPTGGCSLSSAAGWRPLAHYPLPQAGTTILVLSDLGCNDCNDQRRWRWRRFGAQLARTGCRPVALMPSPPRWWDAELTQLFTAVYWDRAVRPPQRLSTKPRYANAANAGRDSLAAETLLTVLATAVRIEPALLRASRYEFPATTMDVGDEFAAWNHPALHTTLLAAYFQPAPAVQYRQRLREDQTISPAQKHRIAALQSVHHAHLSPVICYEEQLAWAELFGSEPPEQAQDFAQKLAKTLANNNGDIAANTADWLNRVLHRQDLDPTLWHNSYLAAAAVAAFNNKRISTLPATIRPEHYAWLLGNHPPAVCVLVQQGQHLHFTATANGSPITRLRHSAAFLQIETADGKTQCQALQQPLALMPKQSLHIRSDREATVLAWMTRPSWAEVLGQDRYGLYADLNLNGITQRFRWIPPGVFMMGSPESEPERYDDESQHEVTLRLGYWLADTACTQALWLAVMGENPRRFNDDLNNPVDSVRWNDCQQFIQRLNGLIPDLAARLPTEAEWEYACRAGTTTPFSFGDNITTEQVNYNGNYPYNNGKNGEYRQKTVAVKSLSANPWGLYEMHGNVWEWCADWFGDYPTTAVENPTGPTAGATRVVRGGAWLIYGRFVRSAYRSRNAPDFRNFNLGFRLALGHSGAASQADGRRAVAGQTAAR